MTEYFDNTVAYLEIHDFDKKTGDLISKGISKGIPVVIMVQSSHCGHCISAKPAFQSFARANKGKVFCATIQVDGERESEIQLGQILKNLKPSFRGFPDYLLYKNGKRAIREPAGRGVKDLQDFSRL